MSTKTKKDKNNALDVSLDLDKLAAHVGLVACSLASIAVVSEAFEHKHSKHAEAVAPAYAHTYEHPEKGAAEEMRKEEIRHMHISYGAHMRSHPTAGPA
jgi:hypothetical protein